MILDLIRTALGTAPAGFECLEYVFSFFLLCLGLWIVYQIFNVLFSFVKGRR